ncbi:hypothetical protein Y032_0012g1760 [Ancylostoma ceylanicum]|uniref:Uncharacterized protein n=1 Tax=Ancylostoma ceylanicum TaxID=53326 RepID=A0A016VCQ2_9BILA|nr:hypothetical protein Y032_0012g1760 [Ancylostoma ceylanicum]
MDFSENLYTEVIRGADHKYGKHLPPESRFEGEPSRKVRSYTTPYSTLKNLSMRYSSEIVRDESSSAKTDKINKIDIIMQNDHDIRDQHLQLPLYASFQRNP